MRTTTVNGLNIKYADAIGFAFMPCVLMVSGSTLASVDVKLFYGDSGYRYSVSAYKGSVVTDYREYIQAFFDAVKFGQLDYAEKCMRSELGGVVSVAITAKNTNDSVVGDFTFSTFYVWGALGHRETWNNHKRLVWFRNFPFTFGVYADAATTVLVGRNNVPWEYVELPEQGMYEITSANFPKSGEWSSIYNYDGEIKQVTFSDAFDLTFRLQGGTQSYLMRIDIDESDSGTYLRWIDRHGFYRYWLFVAGNQTRAVSSDTSYVRNNLGEYDETSGYCGTSGRRQSYEREDTVALCAPLVDSDTYDMLQDIASSPVVDLYMGGGKWQSVTIKTGSYTKTTAVLQDFTCNMVINGINIQRL